MTAIEVSPLPLSHDHVVKMEDRKRPSPYDHNDSAPPLKRVATANATTKHDAEMPWKDDLERFQKDAIYRQMQEYKREKNAAEAQLKEMRKKARYHDEHLRIIDLWFKQLIDEIKTMVQDQGTDTCDITSLPSSLLFSDNETFERHLQDRSRDIEAIMTHLFSHAMSANPDALKLQDRLSHLLAAEKQHILELELHQQEKKELDESLENAVLRYMSAEKKLDRAKSSTVAKLERQVLLGAHPSPTDEANGIKRENGNTNGVMENGENVAELEEAHSKALAVSRKQKEQMENLEAENTKLTAQLTELASKSSRLTDEDYASTDLFKQIKSQHEDVIKRVNNLEALNIQLQQEAVKLQAERTSFRSLLEAESRAAISEKEALLATAETNLARIRTNRDELLADQTIRRSAQDQDRGSAQKARELAAANEDRIRALELENERLATTKATESPMSANLSALDSVELQTRYQELDHKYNMLSDELASMQTAFQKASKAASQKVSELSALEEKVMRLSAEKAKADQKYFAAMKSKETREAEVRTLRLQNTKSSDVVSQLKESEAVSRSLVSNLEKQLTEIRDALNTKTNNQRTCQQQLNESGILVEGLKAQVAELKKVLVVKDASLATSGSACRQAELEVEELKVTLAETKKSLESWKSKGIGNQSEEYEMLRHLAICTVCRKNFKDTAIKTCGHVFCKECVEERVTSRSRKCPNCSKAFGSNDYMKITL